MKTNLADVLLSSRGTPPAEAGEYGISWLIELRFHDPEWYRDRSLTEVVVDTFAQARWWKELEVLGISHRRGQRFASADDVKAALSTGERAVVTIARGDPSIAMWHEDTDAALKIETGPSSLDVMFRLMRGSLERHRDAVLTDTIDAVSALAARWRTLGRLAYCVGFPFPPNRIPYPHVRPPRTALRRLDAIVDMVDPALPRELVGGPHVDDARAMGTAPVPEGVVRTERDGVIALRWVTDPTDAVAMAVACARHERWIVPLITCEQKPGWNAAGDLEVDLGDDTTRVELVVGVDGSIDPAAWKTAADAAQPGVAIVAQDRAAALRIADHARAAGLRVLYRDDGALWDPFPPGAWQEPL